MHCLGCLSNARRPLILIRVLLVAALVTLPASVAANAEPVEESGLANAPTLPLRRSRSHSGPCVLRSDRHDDADHCPFRPGMTPASLNVTAQLPVNVRSGTVTVSQDDRVLAQVNVPPVRGPLVDPAGRCPGRRQRGHRPAAQLPAAVRRVLPGSDQPAAADQRRCHLRRRRAAARHGRRLPAAGAAQAGDLRGPERHRRWSPTRWSGWPPRWRRTTATQNPEIAVAPLADPAGPPPRAAAPLERHIVIAEGPDAGVSLYGPGPMPALLISGPANELTNQTRLITSGVDRLCLEFQGRSGPVAVNAATAGQRDHHPQARAARCQRHRAEPAGRHRTGPDPAGPLGARRPRAPDRVLHTAAEHRRRSAGGDDRRRDHRPLAGRGQRCDRPLGRRARPPAAALHDPGCAGEHLRRHRTLR